MKSINKSLLVAAVLSSALAALAQSPGGQNPGSGGTSPDPSNETNTTNASGARTEGDVRGRTGTTNSGTTSGTKGSNSGMNTDSNTSGVDSSRAHDRGVNDDMSQPKKKRSFWDRLTGRNKQLDTNQNGTGTKGETDSSGRRIETQP
jgi:hypothetical protein